MENHFLVLRFFSMRMNKNQLHKILYAAILLFMVFGLNCDRSDPSSSNNNTIIPTLTPIAVYTLNITEPSGIAYNSKNNTLLIVSDGNPDIYETNFTGNILRTIPTSSSDMEGITLSKNCDTIYVVEETNKLVTTYSESGTRLNSFSFDVATNPKHAMEGISRNLSNGHSFIINEKLPCMLLEFNNSTEIWRKEINYSTDISDIFYDQTDSSLWIVSDESKRILKLTSAGNLISEWGITVVQGEGITIVQDKIYIVSDPESKMYVFQKPM